MSEPNEEIILFAITEENIWDRVTQKADAEVCGLAQARIEALYEDIREDKFLVEDIHKRIGRLIDVYLEDIDILKQRGWW